MSNEEQIETKLKELTSRVNKLTKAIPALRNKVDMLEEPAVSKFLLGAKDDAKQVHDMYRLLILKQITSTELIWSTNRISPELSGELAKTIIKAYDNDDQWWIEKDRYTIGQWIDLLTKELTDGAE